MEPRAVDQTEVNRWLDEARIIRVVNGYFRALDDKRFDVSNFRRILTTDARVIRPNGAATVGPASIVDSHARSFIRFEATQHLLTGHDVDGRRLAHLRTEARCDLADRLLREHVADSMTRQPRARERTAQLVQSTP
jgi:hypothetical protein